VFTTVPQGRTFYYRVSRGDSLATIASRYAVTVGDLRRWNSLGASSGVSAGQKLRVTSDLAPAATGAKRAGGKRSTTASAKPKAKNIKPTRSTPAAPTAKAKATVGG